MNALFSSLSFTNRQWNDLVFQNRNKAYGAYYIRTHYNENVGKAFGITFLFFVGLFVSGYIYFSTSSVKAITLAEPPKVQVTISETKSIIDPPAKVKIKPPVVNRAFPPVISVDTAINQQTDTMPVVQTPPSNGTALPGNLPSGSGGDVNGLSGQKGIVAPIAPDTSVKIVADVMPEFPGGEAALDKYILKHITIPRQWREEGGEGKIYFGFVVGMDGNVRDIKILNDNVGYGCAESNTDLFMKMPTWKPGRQNGYPVNVRMQLPLIFKKQ